MEKVAIVGTHMWISNPRYQLRQTKNRQHHFDWLEQPYTQIVANDDAVVDGPNQQSAAAENRRCIENQR